MFIPPIDFRENCIENCKANDNFFVWNIRKVKKNYFWKNCEIVPIHIDSSIYHQIESNFVNWFSRKYSETSESVAQILSSPKGQV